MLTSRQKRLVRESFGRVAPVCLAAADLFYERLFVLDPSLRPLITGNMTERRHKLIDMLAATVENLGHPEQAVPAVQALGTGHVSYGIQPEHYETVGNALLWTLERCLGDDFTPEAHRAWTETYLLIAATMRRATAVAAA